MKSKKKILACAVILLCFSIMAQSTQAYYVRHAKARNVITTSRIDIDLRETDGVGEPFEDQYNVLPGQKVDKVVLVRNVGPQDAYIRIRVDKDFRNAGNRPDPSLILLNIDESSWTLHDGYYYYNEPLAGGEEAPPLFTKVTFSRSMGNHGLSVLASRFDLECKNLQSDCACLAAAVESLITQTDNGKELKFMRDATRGGVLGIISEIFEKSALSAKLYSEKFPVDAEAAAIAKMLGIDPGFAACEGCLVAVAESKCAGKIVEALQKLPGGAGAAVIGEVVAGDGSVNISSSWGALRKLVVPDGDQLPRIC